jgi:branched-chain amino acid transport system permease protein
MGPLVALVVLALLPYSAVSVPVLFDGALNSPGTLQLLAICLVFGGLATGYDLMFGRTGMLSFGHALYFAGGGYGTTILVDRTSLPLWLCVAVAVVATAVLALLLGAVALRTNGIAFAMVTLAFAQVGFITVARNPGGMTGGDEGLSLDGSRLPSFLVGVVNTVNLYWIALAFAAVAVVLVAGISHAPAGRVLAAIRDDERRVGVIGLSPYRYRLLAFVLSGALAAVAGSVYALLVGGASPAVAASNFTLSLLVMVVLGGPGTRWGPMLGGFLFAFLDHRLTAVGASDTVAGLPGWIRGPLSQPLFLLGSICILAVFFVPGGLASFKTRLTPLRRAIPRRGPSQIVES